MIKFLYKFFIVVLILSSCGSSKSKEELTIYEKIIQDIKFNEKYINYKKGYKDSCSLFEISTNERPFCMFDIESLKWLNPKSIDLVNTYEELKCEEVKYGKNYNVESKNLSLDRYSDEGKSCFKLWFSEITNDKIVIEIKNVNENSFSYTTMHFIYKINRDNSVEFVETFRAMVN